MQGSQGQTGLGCVPGCFTTARQVAKKKKKNSAFEELDAYFGDPQTVLPLALSPCPRRPLSARTRGTDDLPLRLSPRPPPRVSAEEAELACLGAWPEVTHRLHVLILPRP